MKFKSKVECRQWVETALIRYRFNIPISMELEPFMFGELDALVEHHNEPKRLRGHGVGYFYIGQGMKHKIGIHRIDNTITSFSLVHTIAHSHPKVPNGAAYGAMWWPVATQASSYAEQSLQRRCGVCNALMGIRYPEYVEGWRFVCNKFIVEKGYYSDAPDWIDDWKIFHRDNAILRLVCGDCKV
jgi:hypothetical protein